MGELALEFYQFLFGLSEEPGSIHGGSVRQGKEVEQAEIDSDALVNVSRGLFRIGEIGREVGVPPVRLCG